ncbi:MAG: hypothetical protein QXX38_01280 [Candidatus Aenigmatarchaeota archaeon]
MYTIKKIVILTIIFAGFVFAVSFSTLYAQVHIYEGTACSCTLPIPLLIPTLSSLGIFVGSIVYYLLIPRIEERGVEKAEFWLDILKEDEREVLKEIFKNKGKVLQSKISSKMGKVKTFRVIDRLIKRGIIEKESYGKTNIIKLSEKFNKFLGF